MQNFKLIREKYRSKYPASLVAAAVKIALDMAGNMTGAYKKIEAMKRGLADDKIVKDALRQANEQKENKEKEEAVSPEEKAQLALKHAKEKEALQKRQEREKENMKDEAVSPAQQAAIAIAKKKAKAKLLRRESLSEALSKKISDAEARKIQKKYNLAMDQFQDLKNDYSPAKSARPRAWLALNYPVRDGDYYFSFVSDDEKKNTKFNSKLNDVMRKAADGRKVTDPKKGMELIGQIWSAVSTEIKKFPKDLGWGDTMTREEIYASILHLVGVKEEIEEIAIDKMRIGKRQKAPKYESAIGESDANWAKSLEKINKQRQLDKISDKDKETLMKIAALLGKEKKKR